MTINTKLTKRVVDALKPTEKRYTAWDAEVPGFGVRVSPSGRKSYVFKYRVGGGRSGRIRWAVLGTHGSVTPDQARGLARQWASEVALGGDPASDRLALRQAPTVSELLDQYLADHVDRKNKPNTAREIRRQVERLVRPALGKLKASDVTRTDISRFHSSMSATPYAANRALSLLSKAFSLAEIWGYRPDHSNPCTRVERFAEKSRQRYLSPAEFATLGDVMARAETGPLEVSRRAQPVRINPQAIVAIRLLIFTGARSSEILSLRWEWINWDAQRAELPDSKTGEKHIVLPAAALEILRGLDCPEDGRGFVVRGGRKADPSIKLTNIKDPWRAIRMAAGLPDVRLHDLRHSYGSVSASGGMSPPLIGGLLGHSNTATTARYAHLADDPKQAAAARISSEIEAAMAGKNSGGDVVSMRKGR